MSTDLSRLYAQLGDDAGATLPDPATLRQRADRRTRRVVVAACVAVAVVTAGIAAGASQLLAGPAPQPGGTITPRPTASDSTSPAPSTTWPSTAPPTSTAARPPITSIPNNAFFVQPSDSAMDGTPHAPVDATAPFSLCGHPYLGGAGVNKQRTRKLFYWVGQKGDLPGGTVDQTIFAYAPGGAEAAMRNLRAGIQDCPQYHGFTYTLTNATSRGDDSLLMRSQYIPTSSNAPIPENSLYSIVRVGDVVTMLYVAGWEGMWEEDKDPVLADQYTGLAVTAIENWLDHVS
jgi:hypothetical protein